MAVLTAVLKLVRSNTVRNVYFTAFHFLFLFSFLWDSCSLALYHRFRPLLHMALGDKKSVALLSENLISNIALDPIRISQDLV